MINKIKITNFRCYKDLTIENISRLNVIVGDNGSGKTSILESLFLPLSASVEVALRLRQSRGLEANFNGTRHRIESALWEDFFYNRDMSQSIILEIFGEGDENRSLIISKNSSGITTLPLNMEDSNSFNSSAPITFNWRNQAGTSHVLHPKITQNGIELPETGEDLPNFFHFSANQTIPAMENVNRFSELSRSNKQEEFVKLFSNEYDFIKNINIEVNGGSPALYVTLKNDDIKIPLANISGGVNRMVSIFLAIASQRNSIILIDEIENGIYYKRFGALWRGIIEFIKNHNSQLFITTHSLECLQALSDTMNTSDYDELSIWKIRNTKSIGPEIKKFNGHAFKSGLDIGGDIR
jgi:AAA15 family ATPase/GTPase